MQFDFAGDNLWIVDKETGEAIQAIVLVCVLPYSMLSYVTALPNAKMEYLFQVRIPAQCRPGSPVILGHLC